MICYIPRNELLHQLYVSPTVLTRYTVYTIRFLSRIVRYVFVRSVSHRIGYVFQTIKYASCTIRCVSCLIKHALIFCGQINLSFLKFHQSNCRNKIIRPFRPSSEQSLFVTYQEVKFFMKFFRMLFIRFQNALYDTISFSYGTFF